MSTMMCNLVALLSTAASTAASSDVDEEAELLELLCTTGEPVVEPWRLGDSPTLSDFYDMPEFPTYDGTPDYDTTELTHVEAQLLADLHPADLPPAGVSDSTCTPPPAINPPVGHTEDSPSERRISGPSADEKRYVRPADDDGTIYCLEPADERGNLRLVTLSAGKAAFFNKGAGVDRFTLAPDAPLVATGVTEYLDIIVADKHGVPLNVQGVVREETAKAGLNDGQSMGLRTQIRLQPLPLQVKGTSDTVQEGLNWWREGKQFHVFVGATGKLGIGPTRVASFRFRYSQARKCDGEIVYSEDVPGTFVISSECTDIAKRNAANQKARRKRIEAVIELINADDITHNYSVAELKPKSEDKLAARAADCGVNVHELFTALLSHKSKIWADSWEAKIDVMIKRGRAAIAKEPKAETPTPDKRKATAAKKTTTKVKRCKTEEESGVITPPPSPPRTKARCGTRRPSRSSIRKK